MPELRKDPIVGRWVIISTERGKRPTDFAVEEKGIGGGFCPFCPGNEDKTPPEILAYRAEGTKRDTPGWRIRVVPNKFPALQIEGELNRRGEGIYDMMNGIGAHEVIIETPDHLLFLADLPVDHVRDVLWVFRERIIDLKKDVRFKYVLVFKNHGLAAGASLEHTHSQLIATPILPKRVIEELDGAQRYYHYKERCIFCDIIRQEMETKVRLVAENEGFIALEPFAPRFPFETWIMPLQHNSHYENTRYEDFGRFAAILQTVLQQLSRTLDNPPYNFIVHTAPLQDHATYEYHWHMEIIPKLTKVAGFEWGSGFYINPTPPEEAAKYLRTVQG